MVLGLRTVFGTLGRLGSRFAKFGSRSGSGRITGLRYSKLASSRNSLGGPLSASRSSLLSKKSAFGTIRSKAKNLGRRAWVQTRKGLKGAWRKIEVDPIGSATSAYAATRNPQVTLTIDGLEKEGSIGGQINNPNSLRNYAAFSSW